MGASFDFCVLTATVEELRAVNEVFSTKYEPKFGLRSETIYEVPCLHGPAKTIRVATCGQMGHMSAAVRTGQMITNHQPGLIIFVGTAATLKPEEIQIGDVVIPRKAISRVYDKISEKGQKDYESRVGKGGFREVFFESNALISDVATHDCSPEAMEAIALIPDEAMNLESGDEGTIQLGPETFKLRKPRVFLDVDIFSCSMVVDSLSYRSFLTSLVEANMRKAGVIDMESYGFFSAIQAVRSAGVSSNSQGLMIRGVSDYAGRKKESEALPGNWKAKAVRNAASVTCALIEKLASMGPAGRAA